MMMIAITIIKIILEINNFLGSLKFFTITLHDNYLHHKTTCNYNCITAARSDI